MQLKNIVLLMLITGCCFDTFIASSTIPFYKETANFQLFCTAADVCVADAVLQEAETTFGQFKADFKQAPSAQLIIELYPSIEAFHQAIGKPQSAAWLVGYYGNNRYRLVSPRSPGSFHTYDSIMRSLRAGIASFFLDNLYYKKVPYWFWKGVVLYKAGPSHAQQALAVLAQRPDLLPTLKQLDSLGCYDNENFHKLHGFESTYSMVAFICERWGWNIVLQLLEDYSSFESTMQMSKEEFTKQWSIFFVEKNLKK